MACRCNTCRRMHQSAGLAGPRLAYHHHRSGQNRRNQWRVALPRDRYTSTERQDSVNCKSSELTIGHRAQLGNIRLEAGGADISMTELTQSAQQPVAIGRGPIAD